MKATTLNRILSLLLIALVACVPADAAKRKKKTKRKARTTKVVNKKPTFTGPMSDAQPFVTLNDARPAPGGLDGRIIALWQSHGLYFDQGRNQWQWQRPRLFGTVEDLYTQGYVMTYLMPMLENAGAYVISPRERDLSTMEIIADTDGTSDGDFYLTEGKQKWEESARGGGFAMPKRALVQGENPFAMGTSEMVKTVNGKDASQQSTACWNATFPQQGEYAVYVSYASYPNSATDAQYTINHLGGATHVTVNQTMGGGTWVYLGHYPFARGKQAEPIVELTNVSDQKGTVVSADAVKIGGGMGNVARAPKGESRWDAYESGAPRFTEGSRYWLQWAGMPVEVYSESNGENDYTDDYKSRALWVNYLMGGSEMYPDKPGLKIPIDMAFAFHSDAGTTMDGTVVGTLGIYSTDDGNLLGNGRTRLENRDLTDYVIGSVVNDLRALYRDDWTNRSIRDKKYYEIRETKVPAMILELLSHQNFEDMKYGLDPQFRFDVSRAVYKGILRFLALRYDKPYTVQPLPVHNFAIAWNTDGNYTLSWSETHDELESTATPSYYIVEERVAGGAFKEIATVTSPYYEVKNITDNQIHSYRIVAGNDGGRAFPSEVLALCAGSNSKNKPQLNIVNGFTRISAPDHFEAGEFSGFNYLSDAGVPDVTDIITTGEQYDFRAYSEFINNDMPGFGASRGNLEKMITAGNSHDFVYQHGLAAKAAGYSFISESVEAFAGSINTLSAPAIVDLILGKQKEILPGNGSRGTRYKAFTPELQRRIENHCNAGGSIMVSGAYIGTDLMDNSHSDSLTREADRLFATDILGYTWHIGKGSVDGKVRIVPSPFRSFARRNLQFQTVASVESYSVESPDAIRPAGTDSFSIMQYEENGLTAATATMRTGAGGLTYKVVAMGFPFETIVGNDARNELMADILSFLSGNQTTRK